MVPAEENLTRKIGIFRVDASVTIGTGHVMRCLTLAQALVQRDYRVSFVCRRLDGDAVDLVRSRGFAVSLLETGEKKAAASNDSHRHWLPVSWRTDSEQTTAALSSSDAVDWLVVDHYALDHRWQAALRGACRRILVIDDLADRRHDADILLDQNFYPGYQSRYAELVPGYCRQLLGPRYTLLRSEFEQYREPRARDGSIDRVLVFFGGADADNQTGKVLRAVSDLPQSCRFDIVAGPSNPHRETISRQCAPLDNVTFHHNVQDMARLMNDADLAIGAGGTTTWERCYLGLPAIVLSLAHNQVAVNHAMHDAGACIHLGDTATTAEAIADALQSLAGDPEKLLGMSVAARAIMQDHVGSTGVIEAMESADA